MNFTTKASRTRTIHTTDKAQTTASLEAIVLATRAGVRNPLLRHPPHPTPPRTPPQSPTPSRPTPPSPPDPPQSRNRLRPPPDPPICACARHPRRRLPHAHLRQQPSRLAPRPPPAASPGPHARPLDRRLRWRPDSRPARHLILDCTHLGIKERSAGHARDELERITSDSHVNVGSSRIRQRARAAPLLRRSGRPARRRQPRGHTRKETERRRRPRRTRANARAKRINGGFYN